MKSRYPSTPYKCILNFSLLLIAIVVSTSSAYANPVTFKVDGSVFSVSEGLENAFEVGDKYTVIYTFDSAAKPDASLSSTFGPLFPNAVTQMSISIGDKFTASTTKGDIEYFLTQPTEGNSPTTYSVYFKDLSGTSVAGYNPNLLSIDWFPGDLPSVIESPLTNPLFSAKYGGIGDLSFSGGPPIDRFGTQPSLVMRINSVTNLPIPTAVWLFGSGLLGLFGLKRKQTA